MKGRKREYCRERPNLRKPQPQPMSGLLTTVALILLVVGGVGILNIMLASVTEYI